MKYKSDVNFMYKTPLHNTQLKGEKTPVDILFPSSPKQSKCKKNVYGMHTLQKKRSTLERMLLRLKWTGMLTFIIFLMASNGLQ